MDQNTNNQTLAEQLDYDKDVLKVQSTIPEIKDLYPNDVLIWVNGSGGDYARYRVVLEYKGKTRYLTAPVGEKTSNQAMILGIMEAVKRLTKPVSVCVIEGTELGFKKGLNGQGPNGELVLALLELIVKKGCTLTEVYVPGGADLIRQYIAITDPEKKATHDFVHKKERKIQYREAYWAKYKEETYRECLGKVTEILRKQGVDENVIKMVKAIKP